MTLMGRIQYNESERVMHITGLMNVCAWLRVASFNKCKENKCEKKDTMHMRSSTHGVQATTGHSHNGTFLFTHWLVVERLRTRPEPRFSITWVLFEIPHTCVAHFETGHALKQIHSFLTVDNRYNGQWRLFCFLLQVLENRWNGITKKVIRLDVLRTQSPLWLRVVTTCRELSRYHYEVTHFCSLSLAYHTLLEVEKSKPQQCYLSLT